MIPIRGSMLAVCGAMVLAAGVAQAHDDEGARGRLSGYQEVPAVSSGASATFRARMVGESLEWELSYRGLEGDALQSHIHFGQAGVNGGVAVFLCTNLGNGPAGTQACPLRAGTVRGTATAASVLGPGGQGIAAGEWDELVKAMRAGVTYVNVHSTVWPSGEIRGQLRFDD